MGSIVVSENVSLDGVVQDPTGDEGFRRGGWLRQAGDKNVAAWLQVGLDEALRAKALLLGRRSYEYFAARTSSLENGPAQISAYARRMGSMPKYVLSSTLKDPEWSNTIVLTGDVEREVSKLKREVDGDIVVYASGTLVRTLMEHDLVDQLRLVIYPFALGTGERLFGEMTDKKRLRLVDSRTVGDGLALLTYDRVRVT